MLVYTDFISLSSFSLSLSSQGIVDVGRSRASSRSRSMVLTTVGDSPSDNSTNNANNSAQNGKENISFGAAGTWTF